MKEAISIFILLFFPILYKMVKDWNGFDHRSNSEFLTTAFLIFFNSLLMAGLKMHRDGTEMFLLLKCIVVSITGFQLIFPYLFNLHWVNRKENQGWVIDHPKLSNKIWYIFNHLSDSAVPDKWPIYRKLGWFGRFALWLTLFLLSVKWFTL